MYILAVDSIKCAYIFILGHPRFLNQLSTGLDVIGIAGEMLTSISDTNM